jgi:hypothetical protein
VPNNVGIYIWPNMTMMDALGPHQILGFMPDVASRGGG